MRIFHLAFADEWAKAEREGTYTASTRGLSLDDVGFIHCSQESQVDGVHDRFYRDVSEPLLLLTIDTDLLTSPWRLDDVPGQPDPYPHIYGPLNVDAAVMVETFRASASS